MAKVSLRAYNREIEAMIDRGQLDEAIAHCRHILKTYPKHLETYRLLGKAYLEYKRYGDAADIFSRILVSVPNDFVAQVGMSIIRDEENRLDDAIWHMERAFESQPSNPAIQAELQRLYARRDGVRPPRIRMTRGALAHMYVQGELYPQAISEIKSVLKEDASRADMQALLARACYNSGLKNEAAEVASALLRRYPYSLDANRVLVEILGSSHPESTQVYRQRVFELDPYAAHVTGNVFMSTEVSDAAVNVERLEWNGQPVTMQTDWSESKAISLESGTEEQPDWLNRPLEETPRLDDEQVGSSQPTPPPIFESTAPFEAPPTQPADDIPDFMRAAGWGKSTGASEEGQPAFTEGEAGPEQPIEQGDLPDWVKAMKPAETEAPGQEMEEDLPDWIANIGAGALASQASETPATADDEKADWLDPLAKESQPTPAGELGGELDWLKNLGETEEAATPAQTDDLDWMKNLGETEPVSSTATQAEEPDWMKNLGETEPVSSGEQADDLDWLKNLGGTGSEPAAAEEDDLDWMKNLGSPVEETPSMAKAEEETDWLKGMGEQQESISSESQEDQPEWLKGLESEPAPASPLTEEEKPDWLKEMGEPELTSSAALSEKPDWLNEASSEAELSSSAEEQEQPDRISQTSEEVEPSIPARSPSDFDFLDQLSDEPILQTPPESTPSTAGVEELGVSEQERDDSFAWLESLAARQGATEGLLTKPEERLEEEPEWVKQVKGLKSETPVTQPPAEQPPASLDELGTSEQEQDDSFAWLESLAARQGATEGLLTTPEERREEEPEWVKQAKDLEAQQPPESIMPEPELAQAVSMDQPEPQPEPEEPAAVVESVSMEQPEPEPPVAEMEQPAEVDEVDAWLKSLEGAEEPAESPADETAIWLKNLEEEKEPAPAEPADSTEADLPAWMETIEEREIQAEASGLPSAEAEPETPWMPPAEEAAPVAEQKPEDDQLPSWLSELEQEQEQVATPSDDAEDLPAWLRAEEPAPETPEPTLASDWRPSEPVQTESVSEQPAPQEMEQPEPAPEMMEEKAIVEEIMRLPEQPGPEPAPVLETVEAKPEPPPEPAGRRGSGVTVTPGFDPVLGIARNELSRNNVTGALESYGKLIKKARFLDEVIYDLREALYRYPVDVSIWQSLGDAYMRANRLQDALDAYTKAEELLR